MSGWFKFMAAFFLSPAFIAFAQQAKEQQDVLLPKQSTALVWIVGMGILVVTVIAGFKHPGRTHLD